MKEAQITDAIFLRQTRDYAVIESIITVHTAEE